MNLTKKFPIACAAFLMGSALHAASMDERVACLERQMKCVYMESPLDTCGATTAIGTPQPTDCCGWLFSMDALFWKARVGGTEFAWRVNQPSVSATPSYPLRGGAKEIDPKWAWGLRAAIGYAFEYDGWDVLAQYTYYDSSSSSSSVAGHNASVVPLKGASSIIAGGVFPSEYFFATRAKANLDFNFNRLDVELGRDFYVSPKLSLRPNVGLTSAWITQKESIYYSGGSGAGGLGVNTVQVRDRDQFEGIGPKLGVNTDWYIGAGFSVYANISGALVYGFHDVTHNEQFSAIDANEIEVHGDRHRYSPNALYQGGLAWRHYFDENQRHVTVRFGFDGQYWWDLYQTMGILESSPLKYGEFANDVGIIGLNLNVVIAF